MSSPRSLRASLRLHVTRSLRGSPRVAHLGALSVVALASCLSAACTPADVDRSVSGVDGETARQSDALILGVSPSPTPAQACTSRHWVGRSSDLNSCPAPAPVPPAAHGQWVASKLFATSSPAPGLAGYCAYDWTPDGSGLPDNPDLWLSSLPSDIDGRPHDAWIQRECHVAAVLGEPALNWEEIHRPVLDHAGVSPRWQVNEGMYENVRVALIDTMPEGAWSTLWTRDRHGHGLSLASLISEVSCPRDPDGSWTGSCPATVSPFLALPLVAPEVEDRVLGGSFGRPSHAARAINDAIEQWRGAGAGNSGRLPRLVLNLSLGWEPRWGGHYSHSPDELEAPIRAVHDALMHASCLGALTFAASGNEPGAGQPSMGAVFPAAWGGYHAPDSALCEQFEGAGYASSLPFDTGTGSGYPRALVEAVGAVDTFDRPVITGRKNARPRLVASGANGFGVMPPWTFLWDGAGYAWNTVPEPTTSFTGTSVSTALTSAAAAVAWSYQPDLPPWLVAEILHYGGVPVDSAPWGVVEPELVLGNAGWERDESVRRVSACRAAMVTCSFFGSKYCPSAGFAECPDRMPYAEPIPAGPLTRTKFQELFGATAPIDATGAWPVETLVDDPCEGSFVGYTSAASGGGAGEARCPQRQHNLSSDAPWVSPMPVTQGCPSCLVLLHRVDIGYPAIDIDLRVDPTVYKSALSSPALVFKTALGTTVTVDLSRWLPTMIPGTTYRLTGVKIPTSAIASSAALSFEAPDAAIRVAPLMPLQVFPD